MRSAATTHNHRRDVIADLRRTIEHTERALEAARRDPCAHDVEHLEVSLALAERELEIAEAAEMERAA